LPVDLDTVRSALPLSHERSCVKECSPFRDSSILGYIKRQPRRFFGIDVRDVESLFVWRKGNTVRGFDFPSEKRQLAAGREPVEAAEIEFFARIVERLWQPEGWIREIKVTVGFENQIVWAIQALPLVMVDEDLHFRA